MFSFHSTLTNGQRFFSRFLKRRLSSRLGGAFFCVLFLIAPLSAFSAETRNVIISWSYSGSVSGLAGFKLYQDGTERCSTDDPDLRQLTCTVPFDETASVFTMTAFDVNGIESSVSTPYSVDSPLPLSGGNISPVAIASADVAEGAAPLSVNFNSNGSNDPDGTIVSYSWSFADGETALGSAVSHVFINPGLYPVMLTVEDDQGQSVQSTTTVIVTGETVEGVNTPPTAMLYASVQNGTAPMSVVFDASGSGDLDGGIAGYSWDFGDGEIASGMVVNHTFSVSGIYTIRLTVADFVGATAVASTTVSVQPSQSSEGNMPPVPGLSASAQTGEAPCRITFNAADSADPDGQVAGYFWDFGDGATGTGRNVQHTFDVSGEFTVTLIVTDDKGAMAQAAARMIITSAAPDNAPPEADFSVKKKRDRTTPHASVASDSEVLSLAVEFDASSSYDPDGAIVDFLWDFGDGETADGMTVEHTFALAGVYTVTLSVMDDEGATSDTEKIVVFSDAPVAFDGTLVTSESTEVQGVMEAADSQQFELVYTVVTQPLKGSVVILDSSTGAFVYTPYAASSGLDTFTFQVNNGNLDSNTATITISIATQDGVQETTTTAPVSPFASESGGGGGCSITSVKGGSSSLTADWLLVGACLAWIGLQPGIRSRKK